MNGRMRRADTPPAFWETGGDSVKTSDWQEENLADSPILHPDQRSVKGKNARGDPQARQREPPLGREDTHAC